MQTFNDGPEAAERGEQTRRERRLVGDLRQLGQAQAPARLRAAVLSQLKLVADEYFELETPLGSVWVAYNQLGISAVTQTATAAEFEAFVLHTRGRPARRAAEPPAALMRRLKQHLAGDRSIKLQFDLRGLGEFEQAVLLAALKIPWGEVRPYGWIAREIDRPKAVRAVGTALGHNPIPLFIPCHRVVRSDGHMGNYSLGGPGAKLKVLAAEGVDPEGLETLARAGIRYLGSDTTHVFCFPTCRHARTISDRHLVKFGSTTQAHAAGYRACKVCRPVEVAA